MTTVEEDKEWMFEMDKLLSDLFGPDSCQYEYTEENNCVLKDDQLPLVDYSHSDWDKILDVPQHLNDKESKFNCTIDEENEVTPGKSVNTTKKEKTPNCRNNKNKGSSSAIVNNLNSISGTLTRGEVSILQLPKVSKQFRESDVVVVHNPSSLTNPSEVNVRLCESSVLYALNLLSERANMDSDDDDDDDDKNDSKIIAISIANLGVFTR